MAWTINIDREPLNFIAEGSSSTANAGNFAELFVDAYVGEIEFNNLAVGGTDLSGMVTRGSTVDGYLLSGYINVLLVQPLRNDVTGASNLSDGACDTLLATLADYLDDRRAAGWYVVLTTLWNRADQNSDNNDLDRAYINPIMLTWVGDHCEAIAGFGEDEVVGADDFFESNATYSADELHPTAACYVLMEAIVAPVVGAVTYDAEFVSSTYVGPGDIQTFQRWGGLRAYSAATIGQSVVKLIRASDADEETFKCDTDGVSLISTTGGASVATWINGTTAKVVSLWDQVGNTEYWVQATDANRPTFTLNGISTGQHCLTFAGCHGIFTAGADTVNQPYTLYSVAKRTASPTAFQTLLSSYTNSGNGQCFFGFQNEANKMRWRVTTGDTAITPAADEGVLHMFGALANGGSSASKAFVNGVATTGSLATHNFNDRWAIGSIGALSSNQLTGVWCEGGVIASDASAKMTGALHHNTSVFWGTA